MAEEQYGWKLTIVDYEHNDDDEGTIEKYYIQRRNAVKAGAEFLTKMLTELEWEDDHIVEAQRQYRELTAGQGDAISAPDSFFNHNSIDVELILIPYEDELK